MFKTITLITLATFGFAACGSDPLTGTIDVSVVETTAPETTAAPPPPPPAPTTSTECDGTLWTASDLIPTNWTEWCDGIIAAAYVADSMTDDELLAACAQFWVTSDEEIVDSLVYDGMTRSFAIGFLDLLWNVC